MVNLTAMELWVTVFLKSSYEIDVYNNWDLGFEMDGEMFIREILPLRGVASPEKGVLRECTIFFSDLESSDLVIIVNITCFICTIVYNIF